MPINSKYHNSKIFIDGIKFDSKREAKRYSELKILETAGKISDLKLQQKFILIPAQYECRNGKKGKCVERECAYKADFSYLENGEIVVEDVKGFRTDVYKIKRKLMLHVHGIRIKEI